MTHRTIEVGAITMHVAEAGSGPPVLLLHGWPQHWYAWRKVVPGLATDHHVICPDLRGFGWSDAPPGRYDKATLAQDIIGLLDAMKLERVDLVAHDWGAWIGFIMCLERPERFDHYLALNMYTPWPEPPSPRAVAVTARLWYQLLIATPGLGPYVIRRTPFVRRLITAGAVHQAWTGRSWTHSPRHSTRASAPGPRPRSIAPSCFASSLPSCGGSSPAAG